MPPKPVSVSDRQPRLLRDLPAAFRGFFAASAITAALALVAPDAAACPACAAGIAARAEVLDDGFFRNLAIAVLPFVIIGAVCLRADHVGRARS